MNDNSKANYLWILFGIAVIALLIGIQACRERPSPDPVPPTATVTATPTAAVDEVATKTPTPTAATATPTPRPPTATATATARPTETPVVPATATPELIGVHRVMPGDTLWDIAGAWYGGAGCYEYCGHLKWALIFEANRDRIDVPQLIYPNQSLRVPKPQNE
jgi:nucleoid-associated protein YgaU